MKLVSSFKSFLADVVNLNDSRIGSLETSVEAIRKFLNQSNYEAGIVEFFEQGSWAHETIIKPLNGDEFDADLLVVVEEVSDWKPKDYVNRLGKVFQDSSVYSDKVKVHDFCITIVYSGEKRIDIAPLVKDRSGIKRYEVCDRKNDAFVRSEPFEYTKWIKERNTYSGANSFRKVTRLLKYLRDIKGTFTCPSVLLTTLVGMQIDWNDKESEVFSDTPTTLKTVMGRLDNWLQARPSKPKIPNPKLPSEDFANKLTEDQYRNFRTFINKYRGWIDDAFSEEDKEESILKWRRVFGSDFAKAEVLTKSALAESSPYAALLNSTAAHSNDLVEAFLRFGAKFLPAKFYKPPYLVEPHWKTIGRVSELVFIEATWHRSKYGPGRTVADGTVLAASGGLWLDLKVNYGEPVPDHCRVEWRITNTGLSALNARAGRGDFYPPTDGKRRWEALMYRGVHFVEAFVLLRADDTLIGRSKPFHVVIE